MYVILFKYTPYYLSIKPKTTAPLKTLQSNTDYSYIQDSRANFPKVSRHYTKTYDTDYLQTQTADF